jgi:hypothetical protein
MGQNNVFSLFSPIGQPFPYQTVLFRLAGFGTVRSEIESHRRKV